MWVYFNDNEQVITSIPHGETIKQGGTFNVYVAFNKSYFQNKAGNVLLSSEDLLNWIKFNIQATFRFGNGYEFGPVVGPVIPTIERFEKIKDNENVCALKDGETYVVYHYMGLPGDTTQYGDFILLFELTEGYLDPNDEAGKTFIVTNKNISGPINIYIEPTYGYEVPNVNVTMEQIDLLIAHIQEYSRELANVNYTDLSKKFVKIENQNIVDLRDYDTTPIDNSEDFANAIRGFKEHFDSRIYYTKLSDETSIVGLVDEEGRVFTLTSLGKIAYYSEDNGYEPIEILNDINGKLRISAKNNSTYHFDAKNNDIYLYDPYGNILYLKNDYSKINLNKKGVESTLTIPSKSGTIALEEDVDKKVKEAFSKYVKEALASKY